VVAVAARNLSAAQKYAKKHGIKTVHTTYEELIQDPEIDAIYNPLPNGLHFEWTIKALQAGKHVLCEKPFASNELESEKMCKLADEKGLIVVEAFHYRYHPATKRLMDILQSGEIGDIQTVDARLCIPFIIFNKNDIRFNLVAGVSWI